MSTLAERMNEALAESGKSQTDLANACGVKPPSVNAWLTGETLSLKAKSAQRAAAFLGVNPLWLTEGVGPKRPNKHQPAPASPPPGPPELPEGLAPIAVWEHPEELPEGQFIKVPRLNVRLSAGRGKGEHLEVDLERSNPQVFRAEWARKERLRPGKLASMYADGHSMEPRIHDGDSLLVDTSQQTVIDGRVYAIWYAGELRVKRLYKRVDGGLIIHSDNERDFPRIEVAPEQMEHIRVIGRVVHMQGTGGL